MASTTRKKTPDLIQKLLKTPKSFSFIQAVRLLSLHKRDEFGGENAFLENGLSVIPELSLGHPSTDIVSIRKKNKAPSLYEMEATFLALYGTSSPLPTFYTEELIEEDRNDERVSRDFLNIFNQLLYTQYYKAFNRYKLPLRTLEQKDQALLNLQYSLMGFGNPHLRKKAEINFEDLRFIKSFAHHSRSAHGLGNYLSWRLQVAHVEIEQCVFRYMPIPKAQYCRLGRGSARLGDAVLGTRIPDLNGKIRIHLKELNNSDIVRFTYKENGHAQIDNSIRQYLNIIPDYDIMLHAKKDAMPCVQLGVKSKARLGINAFLTEPENSLPTQIKIYALQKEAPLKKIAVGKFTTENNTKKEIPTVAA